MAQGEVSPSVLTVPDSADVPLVIYLFGAVIVAFRWGVLNLQVRRMRCNSHPMDMSSSAFITADPELSTPITIGGLNPIILLPHDADQWSFERLQVAITHEKAHIQARDGLWLHLMNLLCVVQWFNPTIWMVRARALMIAEEAADEAVLRSGIRPSQYASMLLTFVAPLTPPPFAGIAIAGNRRLNTRMKRILSSTPSPTPPRVITFASILALVGATASASGLYLQSAHGVQTKPHPTSSADRVDWSKAQFKIAEIDVNDGSKVVCWQQEGKRQEPTKDFMDGKRLGLLKPIGGNRFVNLVVVASDTSKINSPDQLRDIQFRFGYQIGTSSGVHSVNGKTTFLLTFQIPKTEKVGEIDWSAPQGRIIHLFDGTLADNARRIKVSEGPEVQQFRSSPIGQGRQETFKQTILTLDLPPSARGMVWQAEVQDKSNPNSHFLMSTAMPVTQEKQIKIPVNIRKDDIGKIRIVAWQQKWISMGKFALYPK